MDEKEELMKLNEEIRKKEEEIWKAEKKVLEKEEELDLEFAKMEMKIAEEKDPVTHKPIYSNEQARKNAFKLELRDRKDLQEKINFIKTEKNAIKLDEIELKYLLRKFSVLKRLVERREE